MITPKRVWVGKYGNIVTSSPRLAAEMRELGDILVEYVRVTDSQVPQSEQTEYPASGEDSS